MESTSTSPSGNSTVATPTITGSPAPDRSSGEALNPLNLDAESERLRSAQLRTTSPCSLTSTRDADEEESKAKRQPSAGSSSETTEEGEIRSMFEKAEKHPRVVEADQKEEERKQSTAKVQSEREAAASQANSALDSLQDAAVARLESQASPSDRPTFDERSRARRSAAAEQGAAMPARGTSMPSAATLGNPTKETRGLTR